MNSISRFFTLFWIIYFPTCIAYNDLPGFSSIDEVMTAILIIYTFAMKGRNCLNNKPWREFGFFLCILAFYVVYSLIFGRNTPRAVWLDFVQEIRPYSVIYCTWILNPQFSPKQKRLMLGTMILTLLSWIIYNPETTQNIFEAEFPVFGQLAICTGMTYYLFTQDTKRNRIIALLIVCTGLFAPKFKFMGEVVCFIAMMFFVKKRFNFTSLKTQLAFIVLVVAVLTVTWTRFDAYYVTGLYDTDLARPMTYRTSLKILADYFPFGSGMGTFGCLGAWKEYSPLYYEYNLNGIWGLGKGGGFICDAYYPTLAQFGIVGVLLFCVFWKRRIVALNLISDMRYYRIAFVTFFCLAIEQTADSSWLSGKGMGYCMLIALCLNAPRYMTKKEINHLKEEKIRDRLEKERRNALKERRANAKNQ